MICLLEFILKNGLILGRQSVMNDPFLPNQAISNDSLGWNDSFSLIKPLTNLGKFVCREQFTCVNESFIMIFPIESIPLFLPVWLVCIEQFIYSNQSFVTDIFQRYQTFSNNLSSQIEVYFEKNCSILRS